MVTPMLSQDNDRGCRQLPGVFCWTKFGAEAGESAASIFQRKELERKRNHGVFLWGIGNSILPSLVHLLDATDEPQVLFSPMRSAAASRDSRPSRLIVWSKAIGYDGLPFTMPTHSVVTS